MIALLVKGFDERTLVSVNSKLIGNLLKGLKPLLMRGYSVSNKTLAEGGKQER